MSDFLQEILICIVIVSLPIAAFFGIYKYMSSRDDRIWNNGHCDVCGGTWQYEQAFYIIHLCL